MGWIFNTMTEQTGRGALWGIKHTPGALEAAGRSLITPSGYGNVVYKGTTGLINKTFTSVPFGMGVIGTGMAIASYDSSRNTFGSHMSQETAKLAGDIATDMSIFGVGSMFGGWGMAASLAISVGAYSTETNMGAQIGRMFDYAKDKYRMERGYGELPITQNKETMQRTRQGLSLLGQAGAGNNMLGSEATFMHN